ncbi:hypothetical protein NQ317_009347 [Molorchus minor]|uniref:PIR Superfamily Protein n=1 Tax=Molorchus minor TaxID=1323400 RepID=A0ABQ9JL75_9CUCU|nr:hypothetical protein NQ317_009347 [Molorchus minor]
MVSNDLSRMDLETGENYRDSETGEIYCETFYNEETGEFEGNNHHSPTIKFKIPSSALITKENKWIKNYRSTKASKNELELITAAIFLLPTLILFYPVLGLLLFYIHGPTKRTKNLKKIRLCITRALHIILKEFCAKCRYENAKRKITKIQDIRNDKLTKYGSI